MVGTVGRLSEVKQQDVLLRAFARVVQRVRDVHLVLVGDGPMRDTLGELAKELKVADRVHFAGYQAQPEAYLRAMDVFALTSCSEGTPLSILEAWAAGLPVVASAVGGIPELVKDGTTGLLVPFGDEEVLCHALCTVLTDKDRAQRMGDAGRRVVQAGFDVGRIAEVYEHHYRQALPS